MQKLLLFIGILLSGLALHAQIVVNEDPYPLIQCDVNNNGLAYFDLHLADADISFGNESLDFTYHINNTDAQNGINALISPYMNEVPYTQVVFARAQDPQSGLFAIAELELHVVENLPINQPIDLFLVDENDDGFEIFDLTVNIPIVLEGLNPMLYTVAFYETEEDAGMGEFPIEFPAAYYNIQNPQTIYVRINNVSESCIGLASFTISVGALAVDSLLWEDLNIFPNPSSGNVTLQSSQLISETTISLYDVLGKMVFSNKVIPQNGTISLDFSSFKNGVYFVKIASKGRDLVRRIIKR